MALIELDGLTAAQQARDVAIACVTYPTNRMCIEVGSPSSLALASEDPVRFIADMNKRLNDLRWLDSAWEKHVLPLLDDIAIANHAHLEPIEVHGSTFITAHEASLHCVTPPLRILAEDRSFYYPLPNGEQATTGFPFSDAPEDALVGLCKGVIRYLSFLIQNGIGKVGDRVKATKKK